MAQLTDKQMELLNAWNTLANSNNKNGLYQSGGYDNTIASGQNALADTYFKQKGSDTAGFSDEQLKQIQNNAMQANQPKDQSKDLTSKSSGGDFVANGLRGLSDINDNILNAGGGVLDGIFDAGVDFAGQLTNSENADWVKDLKGKTNAETFQLPLSVAADLGLMAAGPAGWAALAGKSFAENGDNFADAISGVDENGNKLTDAQRGLSAAAGLGGTALGMIPGAGGALSKIGGKAAAKELEKAGANKLAKEAADNVDTVRASAKQASKNADEEAAKATAARSEFDNLMSKASTQKDVPALRDARDAYNAAARKANEVREASNNAQNALADAIANSDRLSEAAKAMPELTGLERFAKNYAGDLNLTKPEGPELPNNTLYSVMDRVLGRNTAGEAVEEAAKKGGIRGALDTAGKPIDFLKQQAPTQLAAAGTTVANLMANGADANDIMEYFSNPANVASMLFASKMAGNKANAARFNTPRNLYGNAAFVNEAGNAADNYYGRTEESQDWQDVADALEMVGDENNQAELYALLLNGVDTSGLNLERNYPKENK